MSSPKTSDILAALLASFLFGRRPQPKPDLEESPATDPTAAEPVRYSGKFVYVQSTSQKPGQSADQGEWLILDEDDDGLFGIRPFAGYNGIDMTFLPLRNPWNYYEVVGSCEDWNRLAGLEKDFQDFVADASDKVYDSSVYAQAEHRLKQIAAILDEHRAACDPTEDDEPDDEPDADEADDTLGEPVGDDFDDTEEEEDASLPCGKPNCPECWPNCAPPQAETAELRFPTQRSWHQETVLTVPRRLVAGGINITVRDCVDKITIHVTD